MRHEWCLQISPYAKAQCTKTRLKDETEESEKREQIRLLRLRPVEVQEVREFKDDLVDFVTAPLSVQRIAPEVWLDVWKYTCQENPEWLEWRDCPYCKLCLKDCVFSSHLLSRECWRRQKRFDVTPGSVLKEILWAAALPTQEESEAITSPEAQNSSQVVFGRFRKNQMPIS